MGPASYSYDVLHPVANLPLLRKGDVLVVRRVGAYNQSAATVLGVAQAATRPGTADAALR